MLYFDPISIDQMAEERGWLHKRGRLAGTVNASRMAAELGVAKTTITRAYDGGAAGIILLEKLSEASGMPVDHFIERRAS